MNGTSDDHPGDTQENREADADTARERLFEDIDELDARRVRIEDAFANVRAAAKRHRVLLVGAGVGLLGGAAILVYTRRAKARRRTDTALSRAAAKLLGPGYVVRSVEADEGIVRDALARAGAGLFAKLASELGSHLLGRWLGSTATAGSWERGEAPG